jgi:Zn-dependent peptidase ImmA (M78 family)
MTTPYIAPARIEARTAELWRRHALAPGFDVERLLDDLDLGLMWEEMEEGILGALIPTKRVVVMNQRRLDHLESNLGLRRFTVGHEVGHWILHCEDARAANLQLFESDRTHCRQGSRHPIEVQAEKFAGFLLAPTDVLRGEISPTPWSGWRPVYHLATTFAMSATAMMVRLEEAGFAHKDQNDQPRSGRKPIPGQLELSV